MSIKNSKMSSDIIDISKITELILDEIALEGLEGMNQSLKLKLRFILNKLLIFKVVICQN